MVSLLDQDPNQVQARLESIWRQQHLPEDFNWLGLAYVAADKARGVSTLGLESPNLEWAKVAISVYEFLALNQPNASKLPTLTTSWSVSAHQLPWSLTHR